MALGGSYLKRLPLTTSLLYLAFGAALGPWGAGLIRVDPVDASAMLERVTEFVVIVSLFTAGLKLRLPLSERRWWLPIRLASVSMVVTVALVTIVGVWLLDLPLGAAVLLGAVLAPTDPVLASAVQVEHPYDVDRLRFGLTGEAGLNDGTAFPFVMLGLGLLGLHEIGEFGWRWACVDLLWAVTVGLLIGALAGMTGARVVLYLRKKHKEAIGPDEFIALGLLALSYGAALYVHAYGFLAAFAAGVALRRVEAQHSTGEPPEELPAPPDKVAATDPEKAPAYLAKAVLVFNEQIERLCEVGVVVLLGGLLTWQYLPRDAIWFAPLLFLVIRPVAVWIGLLGVRLPDLQWRLISWFGIRGVGSIYYLMYALQHGVKGEAATRLTGLTLTVVAASITIHGISVTPLMKIYHRFTGRRAHAGGG